MKITQKFLFLTLVYSTIITAQWESRTNGLPNEWGIGNAIDAIDSSTAVIAIHGIYITTNAGNNWFEISPPDNDGKSGVDISMIDKDNIWLVTTAHKKAKILYTSDGGSTWNVQFEDSSKTKFMNYIEMFDEFNGVAMGDGIDAINDPAVFLSTNDGGKNWISINDSAFGGISGDRWLRVDFINPSLGYFYETGINSEKQLYKTDDACNKWEVLNFLGGVNSLKFYNENIGIMSGSNYDENNNFVASITRTTDGGETWKISTDIEYGWGNDFEFIPNDPSQVWFVDGWSHGLFYSNDTGKTWSKTDYSSIELAGRDIVFTDKKHGWILGDNGNLLYTNNNGGLLTDIKDAQNVKIISNFSLEQNYPNPFNPTTTIKYTIPNVDSDFSLRNVTLKIYDVIGNEIKELLNENKSAGIYEITFDASNLSSGVYYYQLVSGGFIQTRKMVLIK